MTAEWAQLACSDARVAVKESWERAFALVDDDNTQWWQAPPGWEAPRSKAGLLSTNPWYGIPPPVWLDGWLASEELSAANYDTGVSILQRIGAKAEEVCKKVWNKVTSVWATRRRTQAQNDRIEKRRAAVRGSRERRRKETSARRWWRQVKRTSEVLLRERRKAALEKLESLMTSPPPRVE